MVINPVLITQIPRNLAQMCILAIFGDQIYDFFMISTKFLYFFNEKRKKMRQNGPANCANLAKFGL